MTTLLSPPNSNQPPTLPTLCVWWRLVYNCTGIEVNVECVESTVQQTSLTVRQNARCLWLGSKASDDPPCCGLLDAASRGCPQCHGHTAVTLNTLTLAIMSGARGRSIRTMFAYVGLNSKLQKIILFCFFVSVNLRWNVCERRTCGGGKDRDILEEPRTNLYFLVVELPTTLLDNNIPWRYLNTIIANQLRLWFAGPQN